MSIWIWLVALVPPIFFAVSNLLDKVAVHGDDEDGNPWTITALSAVFDLIVCLPIGAYYLIDGNVPDIAVALPLFLNGMTFTLACWLFFRSIRNEETSRVVPISQTIPAFGIVLGFYGLEESLSWVTLISIFLLMIGGYTLSIVKGKIRKEILFSMLLSSLLFAVNDYVVAKYGRQVISEDAKDLIGSTKEAMPVIFVDLLGKTFFGLLPLLSRRIRQGFVHGFRSKFKVVAASSLVFTAGDIALDVAKIYAPLAMVQALCCTQPLFVLLGAVILTLTCKRFPPEELGYRSMSQKLFGILMLVAGAILLSI